ncbi:MAG: 30S ribosomal protein S16 [Lentisphaeria bacterium]|nr:30S ribosomal protein S16 [Lentisphaeria bacterium]
MVKLRLRRTGTRNKPCYRVVAADQRSPRDGRFIEVLGYYNPRQEEEKLNLERVDYWLGQGAQASKTVGDIIRRQREGISLTSLTKKEAPVKEEAATAAE